MFTLDKGKKIIHRTALLQPACGDIPAWFRVEVPGVNQKAIDEKGWRYCSHCKPKKKQSSRRKKKAS